MVKKPKSENGPGGMSLPECANYLHLSENTVLKLATDGKLPGLLEGKKWRFERELIDEWLAEKLNVEDEELEEIPDGMRVPLGDLMPINALIGDLESTDALGVIEELAARAYAEKWLNDKPWFVGAVIEREALASTAMEGGVAFLHTRAREANKIARPFIIAGRSYGGVDFGAPDGKPTFLFFLLGLKYDRLHLPILGRLARTMRNPTAIAKLRSLPSAAKMRAQLLQDDAASMSETQRSPVRYEDYQPKLDRQMRLRTIMRLNAIRKREAAKAEAAEKKRQKKAKKTTTKAAAKATTARKPAAKAKATGKAKSTARKTSTRAAAKPASKKAARPAKKAARPATKKAAKPANKRAAASKSTTRKSSK